MVLPTPSLSERAPARSHIVSRQLCGALLAGVLANASCTCGGSTEAAQPTAPAVDLSPRRVPDTDLVVALPQGWRIDLPDPGPMPDAPPPTDTRITLHTRTLLEARPGTPAPGMLVTPQLFVFLDPWLPLGTTGVDYLVAQRTANQRVIGANISVKRSWFLITARVGSQSSSTKNSPCSDSRRGSCF